MRRLVLTCSFLGSLIAAGCSPSGPESTDGPAEQAQSPIVYGTADTTHTAVVALLGTNKDGGFACTGTVVQVKSSTAYVLTAAHCCADGAPYVAIMANNYGPYVGSSNPPAYAVNAASIYYDSQYGVTANNELVHDFCMLKVPGMTSATPIPVAQPGQDGLQVGTQPQGGTQLEHVGYGQTEQDVQDPNSPNPNAARRHGTNTLDISLTSQLLIYSQGGNTNTPGPCHGDSGGPALVPAGAAPSQQKVVGVTSYGPNGQCIGLNAEGASSRVTLVTGPGGFITKYLNDDTSGGTQAGSISPSTCDSCQQTALSQGGACAGTYTTCTNTPACNTLLNCINNCQDQACADTCWNAAGTTGQNAYNAIFTCLCNTGCTTECADMCGGSSSGGTCGLQSNDPTCNSCLTASCCSQATACANNTTCVGCLSNQTTACNSNAQFNAIVQCLQGNCAAPCGLSTSSSSSSGGTSTSSSSSSGGTTTSSSTSAGGGGTTGGGGAAGGAGGGGGAGGNNSQESGCSVGATGSERGSVASLAGMLIGLALAASRRRRAH